MENQQLFLEPQKIEVIGQTVSLKTRETDGLVGLFLLQEAARAGDCPSKASCTEGVMGLKRGVTCGTAWGPHEIVGVAFLVM